MPTYLPYLAALTAGSTVVLLAAGALVTGTGSGLAVPDWPLSFGQAFPPMIGGVLYEHGHRMIAGVVALITCLQAAVFWRRESRIEVKWLALILVLLVLVQATLGGLTVLFRLPPQVSIAHATLAQIFFSGAVLLFLSSTNAWRQKSQKSVTAPLCSLSIGLTALLFIQLLLGATIRHTGAALAITDFPWVFGGIFPPEWTHRVAVHWLHRFIGFAVVIWASVLAYRLLKDRADDFLAVFLCGIVCASAFVQVTLGGLIVWLRRPIPVTTLHLVLGAIILASSVGLSVFLWRRRGAQL